MATITNTILPTQPPLPRMQFVERSGLLSGPGVNVLQAMHRRLNGLVPMLACDCTGTNDLTITPVAISPFVESYFSFLGMAFVAEHTSTGLVTAHLVTPTGALDTLPVYVTNGSAQATTGDIVINLFYTMYYVETVNSGNGGFVLK